MSQEESALSHVHAKENAEHHHDETQSGKTRPDTEKNQYSAQKFNRTRRIRHKRRQTKMSKERNRHADFAQMFPTVIDEQNSQKQPQNQFTQILTATLRDACFFHILYIVSCYPKAMQKNVWEHEYRNPRLVSGSREPQSSVKDFLRFLRRERGIALENLRVLDLGCGNGKNANYIAGLDDTNSVVGIDISETALAEARANANAVGSQSAEYFLHNMGEVLPFPDDSFDIVLDVTSSNSLSEAERAIYLAETHRILKSPHLHLHSQTASGNGSPSGGYLFVRALCKDGDKNAAALLKSDPGPEKDTYIMPGLGLVERVFSREDLLATYANFDLIHLEKETHYTKFAGRSYKRNFWIAYLQKK
jgi:SAM-dependent methyltransferase